METKPGWWRPIVSVVIYISFCLVFVELSLQGFYYVTSGGFLFARTAQALWAPNEFSGFWNKANLATVHSTNEFRTRLYTNSEGFRVPSADQEYAVAKDPGIYRIMLLGPSFAFGWGVDYEDAFAARLVQELNEGNLAPGKQVELIDAGVNSMPVVPQLRWYEHVGADYDPNLVIQFIYGSMAVDARHDNPYAVTPEGYLVMRNPARGLVWRERLKKLASVFYGWVLYSRLDAWLAGPAKAGPVLGAGREMTVQERFDPASPDVRRAVGFYDELRATVEARGARLLVVYFPLSYVIHREDMSRWKHLGVHSLDTQIAFDEAFCSFLRDRDVDCLDVTSDLQRAAAAGSERLYYWLDVHWTPRGNLVVAQAVARHLLAERASAR